MAETHSKPLVDMLLEIRNELASFVRTRVRLFQREFAEAMQSFKSGALLVVMAVVLLGTAYLLLTAALVGLVSFAFLNSPFRWPLAFAMVGGLWLMGGLIAGGLARNAFRSHGTFPDKTVAILKADGLWLKDEVKRIA